MSGSEPRASLPRRWFEAALRLPLFYKIVLANAGIIALAVTGGLLLSPGMGFVEPGHPIHHVAVPLIVAGVAASALANALIVRLALDPVRSLEETAARVKEGDLNARAPESPLADPDLAHLIETFNEVLDSAAAYRRRLREIATRSQRAEEEERRRVALALHDDTAQRLAGLLVRIRLLEPRCEAADEVQELLEEARREVASAIEVVREYALGRRPPSLDDLGLAPALESYAGDVVPDLDAEIRIDLAEDADRIAPDVELALFRIVQEALDNVARHSGGDRVTISVAESDGSVKAVIEDDGRGFDSEEIDDDECLGLFEMRERAAAVGGRLEISSAPGHGTRVEAVLPLEPLADVRVEHEAASEA
ncbi:MAG: ATP-binding protein [Gemmatimonadota bacterium]|nr:ATP-binding protein [Gemmatimonadota bacterium]